MAKKTIAWDSGTGDITVTYNGQGDGTISISSDPNNLYTSRSKTITVKTTDGSNIQRTVTIQQAAKVRIDISSAVVTAANQTYSGTAKTPTPTVTLNGVTIPSSGYDVAYSNNTNAGTATITITGKGEYTGTATGTFTINKASRTLSFADTYAVVAPSGTVTKTATPSAGSGDGAITYTISSTTYATINSSTGAVTAKTSEGSAVVTATISEGTNYLSATASYNLYVFATTHNFAYNGSVQNIALPPGSYKIQCWGAQGGSNATDSTYGITAKAGGKGGYAEGVLTIAAQTTLYAFVGGQGGSSGNGGWNCGGGSSGSTTRTSGNDTYLAKMGCGGGATDFALTTSSMTYSSSRNNRSLASLLSRIIVAGGGSGGAMVCKRSVSQQVVQTITRSQLVTQTGAINSSNKWTTSSNYTCTFIDVTQLRGDTVIFDCTGTNYGYTQFSFVKSIPTTSGQTPDWATGYSSRVQTDAVSNTATVPSDAVYMYVTCGYKTEEYRPASIVFKVESTTNTTESQVGYAGGGVNSEAYSSDYVATQDDAGSGGDFGLGANQTATTAYIASGAGGAGWYGGGRTSSGTASTTMRLVKMSGGGSGFVNIAANAQYRPSGYTGIELDSGTTTIGTSSFPSTSGGTETGHSGNGYAKITRLA